MGQGPPRERGSDADQRGGGTCTCWGLLVQGVVTGCPRKGLGWHTGLRVPGSVPSCCSCARHPKTLELSGGGRAVPGSGQPWAASPCSLPSESFPHKGPGWHYLKLPAGSTSSRVTGLSRDARRLAAGPGNSPSPREQGGGLPQALSRSLVYPSGWQELSAEALLSPKGPAGLLRNPLVLCGSRGGGGGGQVQLREPLASWEWQAWALGGMSPGEAPLI